MKKFRRLDSTREYKSSMDKFFETNLDAQEEFIKTLDIEAMIREAMGAAGVDGQIDMDKLQRFQNSVASQSVAFLQDRQRENITALWEEYDADQSGDLSPAEIVKLLEDHLVVQKKNIASTIDSSLEVAMEQGIGPATAMAKMQCETKARDMFPEATETELEDHVAEMLAGFPSDDQLRAQMAKAMTSLKPKFLETVLRSFEQIQSNMDEVCECMMKEMDVNHDGRIDRHEFEEHILEAMMHIVDVGKLLGSVT